jgi:hypothetical protein
MSEAELRVMVRDVLREVLGKNGQAGRVVAAAPAATEAVRISNDVDLAAFVQRLVRLVDDPATASAVRAGRHRFTLAVAQPSVAGPLPATPSPSAVSPGQDEALEGTVTEARVKRSARAGKIVLAPGAVMTPLARDRARALGLKIERIR